MLRLCQPDRDPEEIKARRAYARRTLYFGRAELPRLILDAFRAADGKLIATEEITGNVIEAKGFDAADAAMRKAIGEQILPVLQGFGKRGTVEQSGLGRGTRWKLASPSERCVNRA